MMSPAILRVSSVVRVGKPATRTGVSRPLSSTVGARPGDRKRSLTFAEVCNIADNSACVDIGSEAGTVNTLLLGLGAGAGVEDIDEVEARCMPLEVPGEVAQFHQVTNYSNRRVGTRFAGIG